MSRNNRLVTLVLLTALLVILFWFPPTDPKVSAEIAALLFSSLFLASFTALLLEHFFARPTDVLAAAVSILLLLVPSRELLSRWGQWYWGFFAYEAFLVIASSAALFLLTSTEGDGSWRNRCSKVLKDLVTRMGPGKVQYFFLFFLTLLFYVEPQSLPFVALLIYAAFVVVVEPSRLAVVLPHLLRRDTAEVGEIIGVQGQSTFLARLHPKGTRPVVQMNSLLEFSYGMDESPRVRRGVVVERFFLDQSQWIRILCHTEIDKLSARLSDLRRHRRNAVYVRPGYDASAFLGSLVGLVKDGSDVTTLRFWQVGGGQVREGDLVRVEVEGSSVLYQVTNAEIDTEALESRNEADFVVGRATQLGVLLPGSATFERFGWVPVARTPVVRATQLSTPPLSTDEIEIGKIPGTAYPVVVNAKEVVSHHLAILGVTGVGKSVFARRLIQNLTTRDLRVIVVDFTREWQSKLDGLGAVTLIAEANAEPLRQAISELVDELAKFKNQQREPYINERKATLSAGFREAIDGFLADPESRIAIFELPDVSNTEGVLEYTQWFFRMLFQIARQGQNHDRRVCIVLEEAHTVVPEWNFIGLADRSSQALVNNISQIALQGRKYDVGFVVIAQRTASVSKTVLTQCNTMIAFQCFDGTSIEFLSHYLPRALAESLPNLRARRAIAVGKAVRGSVPLIFDVPDIDEAGGEENGAAPA
ncbi:MAG: ATP-binding protein [Acidobacteria bacterium]|nr:ATP-binding protein [Acidobacteriota bacterium]